MEITYDPAKREATLRTRGLDFRDLVKVLAGRFFTVPDTRFDYGEERQQTIGYLDGRMVMVVWTQRGNARHVMSMRRCNAREQEKYGKRLGQS